MPNLLAKASLIAGNLDQVNERAARALDAAVERGAAIYVREKHLPVLLRITQEEMADTSRAGHASIINRLTFKERKVARRALGGVGTGLCPYSFAQHVAVKQALLAEKRAMALDLGRGVHDV